MAGCTEVLVTLKGGGRVQMQIIAACKQSGAPGSVRRTPLCGTVQYFASGHPVVRIDMAAPEHYPHIKHSLHISAQIPDDRGSWKLPATICAADIGRDDIEAILNTYYTDGTDPECQIESEPIDLSFTGGPSWTVSYVATPGDKFKFVFKEDDDEGGNHTLMHVIVQGPPLVAPASPAGKRGPSAELGQASDLKRPHTRSRGGVAGHV